MTNEGCYGDGRLPGDGHSLLSTFGPKQRPVVAICCETERIPMLVVESGFPDSQNSLLL